MNRVYLHTISLAHLVVTTSVLCGRKFCALLTTRWRRNVTMAEEVTSYFPRFLRERISPTISHLRRFRGEEKKLRSESAAIREFLERQRSAAFGTENAS